MQKTLVSLSVLLSVCLAGVQSLAADGDLWQGYTGKGFLKSPSRPVVDLPESMMTHLRTGTSFTLPLSSQRERRGTKCGLLEPILEHTPVSVFLCWPHTSAHSLTPHTKPHELASQVYRIFPCVLNLLQFLPNNDGNDRSVVYIARTVRPWQPNYSLQLSFIL